MPPLFSAVASCVLPKCVQVDDSIVLEREAWWKVPCWQGFSGITRLVGEIKGYSEGVCVCRQNKDKAALGCPKRLN